MTSGPSERAPRPTRREVLAAAVSGGVAGLAGCSGGPAESWQDDAAADGDAAETGPVAVALPNHYRGSNVNPWAADDDAGRGLVTELVAPVELSTGTVLTSGHAVETPRLPEEGPVSVPTVLQAVDLEPPFGARLGLDDRLTYWEGTPIDAEALRHHDHVGYFDAGGKFAEGETFNREVLDQWTYHAWRDRGEIPEQSPKPTNERVLRAWATRLLEAPMHPEFTEPYREMFEAASTVESVRAVRENLHEDDVSYERVVQEGWGSGRYVVEGGDASRAAMVGRLRTDHPGADQSVSGPETVRFPFGNPDRQHLRARGDRLDLIEGTVGPSGRFARESLPASLEEVATVPTDRTDLLAFDWTDPHLRRLWVRRALVAAVDWRGVRADGPGRARSRAVSVHDGLADHVSLATFEASFRESLHAWPERAKPDLAGEYLRRGGYRRRSGRWVGPGGRPLELSVAFALEASGSAGAAGRIRSDLETVDVPVEPRGLTWRGYAAALDPAAPEFEMALGWAPHRTAPEFYRRSASWHRRTLLGAAPGSGDLDLSGPTQPEDLPTVGPEHQADAWGRPTTVDVPARPGVVAAPERAGRRPSLEEGVTVDLVGVLESLRSSETDPGRLHDLLRRCATVYQFYLPSFAYRTPVRGVVADRDAVSVPGTDHRATGIRAGVPPRYLLQAGLVRRRTPG